VGGSFTTIAGQARTALARLSPDGTLDTAFNPQIGMLSVNALALQDDGRILVGGDSSSIGPPQRNLCRISAGGVVDSTFNPILSGGPFPSDSASVSTLAVQADGAILVGGTFNGLNGATRTNLGRLNANGSLDAGFDPGLARFNSVDRVVLQPDGAILVGGSFSRIGGQVLTNCARLNSDGTADATFNPGVNRDVTALGLQADGKILIAGAFYQVGGATRTNLARITAGGSLDATFNGLISGPSSFPFPLFPQWVDCLLSQPDGKLVIGGTISSLAHLPRQNIGRLNATGPANQSLTFDGITVTWLRSGPAPELSRVTFDASTDGYSFFTLGTPVRISGGWQVGAGGVPTNATIRARGFVAEGDSFWFLENALGPPAFSTSPASRTNFAGTTATFSAVAAGASPLTYRWYDTSGTILNDGGRRFRSAHTKPNSLERVRSPGRHLFRVGQQRARHYDPAGDADGHRSVHLSPTHQPASSVGTNDYYLGWRFRDISFELSVAQEWRRFA